MKKRILLYGALLIILLLGCFYLYALYPSTPKNQNGACIEVLATAHHPIFPFIKQTYGTPCVVPDGWVMEK